MSIRLLIAISQREDRVLARAEIRDALDQRLTDWVRVFGAIPLPVPNRLGDDLVPWLGKLAPDAVILSGGNDIGDSLERDRTETALLEYAAKNGLPVLGICRGMQMLAYHAGGTLMPVSGHAGTRHTLHGEEVVIGAFPDEVNSFHNWGILDCPPDYEVLATAPDGSVEAIRHLIHRWEGWMWHPERDSMFSQIIIERFKRLINAK